MADRDGILIWTEIPVNQYVGKQYLGQPAWVARAHALLEDNILTNQNHPSVMLWSIGNELPTPATAAETSYIAGAASLAHHLDPTRPVGMSVSDWPGVPCQHAYAPLDVIGVNEYFGWFDAGGGATDDEAALSPFLDSFQGLLPHKGLVCERVRVRRQPRRAGRGARHLPVPIRCGRLSPRRVRVQAMALGRDVLHASGRRDLPRLFGRQSMAGPSVRPEGPRRSIREPQAGVRGRRLELQGHGADRAA